MDLIKKEPICFYIENRSKITLPFKRQFSSTSAAKVTVKIKPRVARTVPFAPLTFSSLFFHLTEIPFSSPPFNPNERNPSTAQLAGGAICR